MLLRKCSDRQMLPQSRYQFQILRFLRKVFYCCALMSVYGTALYADDSIKQDKSPVLASVKLENGETANLEAAGMKLRVTRKATKTGWSITLSGKTSNGSFKGTYSFSNVADYPSELVIAELDPTNAAPEIMFSAYSGGAHCCEIPVVYEEIEPGNWVFVEHVMNDATPPIIEDIDRDGVGELVTFDQSFFYAFDSYAASYSPIMIERLRQGSFINVTKTKLGLKRLKAQIDEMETSAENRPDLWRSNGFLAAWVALKARLGEGREAWRKMLLLYDRNSSFGTYECADKSVKIYECPAQKLILIPFPEALKRHLVKRGYWDKKI